MLINPSYLKRKAKKSLHGNWQTALLVTFFAGCLFTLLSVLTTLYANELVGNMNTASTEFYQAVFSAAGGLTQEAALTEEEAAQGLQTMATLTESQFADIMDKYQQFWETFQDPRWSILLWTLLGAMLVTPVLSLGKCKYYLDRARGEDPSVWQGLFGYLRYFLKAFGVYALYVLKVILWGLISIPVVLVLTLTGALTGTFGSLLIFASLIPAFLAYLRYFPAPWFLAEKPEEGVRAALRRSKEWMKDKKKNLFLVLISFIGLYFLILIAEELLLMAGLPQYLVITLALFAELALNVYMDATAAQFIVIGTDQKLMNGMLDELQRMMRQAGMDEEVIRSLDKEKQADAEESENQPEEGD